MATWYMYTMYLLHFPFLTVTSKREIFICKYYTFIRITSALWAFSPLNLPMTTKVQDLNLVLHSVYCISIYNFIQKYFLVFLIDSFRFMVNDVRSVIVHVNDVIRCINCYKPLRFLWEIFLHCTHKIVIGNIFIFDVRYAFA